MRTTASRVRATVRFALCAATVGVTGLVAGCRTTSGIEVGAAAVQTPDGNYQLSKLQVINNERLAGAIQVVDVRSAFVGDLLRANLTLVSSSSRTQDFQYKFVWFDASGMEVYPDANAWTPMLLYGHESKAIQATAPAPSVREFKVKIRGR